MSAVYQDGTFPSGAPTLSINSVDYICNSLTFPQQSDNVVNITDGDGLHSGALSFAGPQTGTAEVQLATNSTAFPTTASQNSTTGTFVLASNGANVNCFITSVTVNKPSAGPWTASLSFQGDVN